MATTYEPIATTTLGSAQATVSFNSFSGYTDLVLIGRMTTTHTASSALQMTFNGDTASNYSVTRLYGNGTTATSDRFSSQSNIDTGFMPGTNGTGQGTVIFNIMNYANTTTFKTILNRWESQAGASGSQYTTAEVGLYRSTSAITSLSMAFTTGNIATGSTFTLYGIKAA